VRVPKVLPDGESALRCKQKSAGLDLGSSWDNSLVLYGARRPRKVDVPDNGSLRTADVKKARK
jgi:hypothetical protein